MEIEIVHLSRLEFTDAGTFGCVQFLGHKLMTGELPWRQNQKMISCIPDGEYLCVWTFSPRFQKHTYLLKDVPGRDAIRIHAANYMGDRTMKLRSQLDGCIAFGEAYGWTDKQQYLRESASAVRCFENTMRGQNFKLRITRLLSIKK
jgi:hypothetical protein